MIFGIDIDDTVVKTNERALEIINREGIEQGITYYEQLKDLIKLDLIDTMDSSEVTRVTSFFNIDYTIFNTNKINYQKKLK